MQQNIFKIRRAFLIPLWAIIVLLFLLFLLSMLGSQTWEKIIAAVFFIVVLIIGIEASERKIILTEKKLTIKKFFRKKEIDWMKITNLGIVELSKKIYFLLNATRGFYFFSNLVEKHSVLVRMIVEKLDDVKVEPEVKNYLERPMERLSLIVMSYVAVLILVAVIILKLLPA